MGNDGEDNQLIAVVWDRVFILTIALILVWIAVTRLNERVWKLEEGVKGNGGSTAPGPKE